MAYPIFHERGPIDLPAIMDRQTFEQAFAAESLHLEFKQGLPEAKVREAVTAFSNTDGGVILVGVRNDGVVVGVRADGEFTARVHRVVADVRNPGAYDVWTLGVDQKQIVVVSVRRRREGFAQMHDGRVLTRRGAMNVPLFGDDLSRFLAERSLARFETSPVEIRLAAADPAAVENIRRAHGWSADDLPSRFYESGLIERPTGDSRLTVAGALYLLARPGDFVGKCVVEIFRYRDGQPTYDRRTEFGGPLDQQVEQATRALTEELGSDVVVLGVHRYELPRVPEAVLREAVANAVAHRSYENGRQSVRVEVHPDRVLVRSPGGLPEPVTLANIREQNAARNVNVIRVLRRFRLAEDAGMGVDVMQDTMDAAMLEAPRFDADDDHVEVTFRLGSTVTARERAWLNEIEVRGEIRGRDRLLLLHAARGELLTNAGVRELLGMDSVHARAALHRLRDLGYLHQSGERGGAYYTLARELGPPAGLQLDQEGIREVITSMAREGPVTNEQIRDRTGLDRTRTLSALTALVEGGVLTRRGERRGTFYTLS